MGFSGNVRKADAFFPERQRPARIVDGGWKGRAHRVEVHGGDITDVINYIDTLPGDDVVYVVAYGNVYIASPPDTRKHLTKMGTEHRTVLANVRVRNIHRAQYEEELRVNARDFFNPATELHEIEYFSIRHRWVPPTPEEEAEHAKRSRRSVPKRYRD